MSDDGTSLQDEDIKTDVGLKIIQAMVDEVFMIEGTPMLTKKLKDGRWETKPGIPGSEFLLRNAYVGKRKNLIFIFEPADAQEFTVEIEARKMDETFGEFAVLLKENIPELDGIEGEKTDALVRKLISLEFTRRQAVKNDAEQQERERSANVYSDNPNFGRF